MFPRRLGRLTTADLGRVAFKAMANSVRYGPARLSLASKGTFDNVQLRGAPRIL